MPARYNKTPAITVTINPAAGLKFSIPLKHIFIFSIYGIPILNILSAILINPRTGITAPKKIKEGAIMPRHGIINIPESPAIP